MAWLPGYDQIKVNQHNSRGGRVPLFITIHYSAGLSDSRGLGEYFLANPERTASYHFGISRGRRGVPDRDLSNLTQRRRLVTQYVDTNRVAWSSNSKKGAHTREGKQNPNNRGLNIVFCNAGFAHGKHYKGDRWQMKHQKGGARLGWESYRIESIYACADLINQLKREHPTIEYLCGHEDHVFGKVDPGPTFPWHLLSFLTMLPRYYHDWKGRNEPGEWVRQ